MDENENERLKEWGGATISYEESGNDSTNFIIIIFTALMGFALSGSLLFFFWLLFGAS